MATNKQTQKAKEFKEFWITKGYEKGETQQFWISLLQDVFEVKHIENFIEFEKQVKVKSTNFIDAYIPTTKVLIEQKSRDVDLTKPAKQSNNEELTPYLQAKKYANELPYSMRPRWIITCNFLEFRIHDMEKPKDEPTILTLENFEKDYQKLSFIADTKTEEIRREEEISFRAGEIVGKIYDNLLPKYINPDSKETLHSLNVLCVRLVFLLYAEDADIFPKKNQFYDYMKWIPAVEWREKLIKLFEVLDTKPEDRDPYLIDGLKAFPYVNGGLFSDTKVEIPNFDDTLKQIILQEASSDFNWSEISPTIFGAVFESTLNPETRRKGGMHYTSIENIHKVIDPLFLDVLIKEFDAVKEIKDVKKRKKAIEKYQDKLATLRFFDPACGSGNFLTETYLSLRRLENKALFEYYNGQTMLGEMKNPVKVSINQFYGIEINDFAVTVATTALWISESQMLQQTEQLIQRDLDFLPLKSYTNITEGNALTLDWQEVIKGREIHYIIGNPPFVGARIMTTEQKNDLLNVLGKDWKNLGNMDYVCGWYKKAADLIQGTQTKAALVSTNSITQGEQVANLWCPLIENQNIEILFAHRTFRWDSEATLKAHVHCVVIGFWCNPKKVSAPGTSPSLRGCHEVAGESLHNSKNCHAVAEAPNPQPKSPTDFSFISPEYLVQHNINPQGLIFSKNHLPYNPVLKNYSKDLRNDSELSEVLLWNQLKGTKLGYAFQRQKPILNYIADFYCKELSLVIEIDGKTHFSAQAQEYDKERDRQMHALGLTVVRIEDSAVRKDAEHVARCIKEQYILAKENSDDTCGVANQDVLNSPACKQAPPQEGDGRGSGENKSIETNTAQISDKGNTNANKSLSTPQKIIFDGDKKIIVNHINPYLLDAEDVFIYSRTKPLCKVPAISIGNQPIDNGNYLFSKEEMAEFVKKEPKSEKYFIKWYGAEEFLHNSPRYCLWLGDCSPKEFHDMPHCLERVKNVRDYRLKSTRKSTLKLADTPTRFQVENFPDGNYIIVPSTSSEKRRYMPIGFMDNTSIGSNAVHIIPNATLYHFGVLESVVHMAWMRVVCGRLKSDYRYSKDIVYNNFPWPTSEGSNSPACKQSLPQEWDYRRKIEATAQKILDARAKYPDSSLADLYDEATMPIDLRKAHVENDKVVCEAYGWDYKNLTEQDIVARLFEMYKSLEFKV